MSASTPPSADTLREHLLAARVALFEADLALAMGNALAARIHLDLAQAHTGECRKLMPIPPTRSGPIPDLRSPSSAP